MKKFYYLLAGIAVILVTIVACEQASIEVEELQAIQEIENEILKGVDYIVPLEPEIHNNTPSTIIKLSNSGLVKVIRP